MKALLIILLMSSLIAPSAYSTEPDDDGFYKPQVFPVEGVVRNDVLRITSLQVELDETKVEPGHLLSYADLHIKGKFEGGWCTIDNVLLRSTLHSNKKLEDQIYSLELVGVKKDSEQRIELSPMGCMDGTFGDFSLNARVSLTYWSKKTTDVKFTFLIPLDPYLKLEPRKVILNYNDKNGWTHLQ